MLKKILYIAYVILMPVVVFFVIDQLNLLSLEAKQSFQMMPILLYNVLEYLILIIGVAVLFLWRPEQVRKKISIILFSIMTACFFIPIVIDILIYSGVFGDVAGGFFVEILLYFVYHIGFAVILLGSYAANLIYTIARRRLTAPVRSFYDN